METAETWNPTLPFLCTPCI